MKVERFDLVMKYICPKCKEIREDYVHDLDITTDIQGNVSIELWCSCGNYNEFEMK